MLNHFQTSCPFLVSGHGLSSLEHATPFAKEAQAELTQSHIYTTGGGEAYPWLQQELWRAQEKGFETLTQNFQSGR